MSYFVDKSRPNNPLVWGIVCSVLVHIVFFVARIPVWRTHDLNRPMLDNEPIEITQVPPEYLQPPPTPAKKTPAPTKTKDPEIAETEDAGNRELDPNATILSDRTQTAQQQSRAKLIDDFRQKQGTGAKGWEKPETSTAPTGAGGKEITEDSVGEGASPGEKSAGVKRNWKTLSIKDLGVGGDGGAASASDDRLNDVAIGERTILSTREFKFFSYYHRIKELLRQYWKPNVERQLAKIWSKGRTVNEEEMVTKVLVLLDPNGGIRKISRLASSGVTELDEAAVDAFEKAGPFPNPPKGMLDEDGFVRIRWDFILKTESAPTIQFRSAGSPGKAGP